MLIQHGTYVAHRGASKLAPENTLAAFRKAYDAGASSVELDVALSADGEFFVMHDDKLERTTGGQGKISQAHSSIIEKLDAGSWFSPEFRGEPVPRLREVLDWAKDRVHLTIEMKVSAAKPGVDQRLVQMLEDRDQTEQVSVISFDQAFVESVERLNPTIDTGVLLSERPTFEAVKNATALGLTAGIATGLIAGSLGLVAGLPVGVAIAAAGAGFGALMGLTAAQANLEARTEPIKADAVMPFWTDVSRQFVRISADRGQKVIPYTANHPHLVGRLLRDGVAAVITDRPEQFCQPRG